MEAPYWPPFTTIPVTESGSGIAVHWTAHHDRLNTETHPPNLSLSRLLGTRFPNPSPPLTEAPRRTARALDGDVLSLSPNAGWVALFNLREEGTHFPSRYVRTCGTPSCDRAAVFDGVALGTSRRR